MSVGMRHVGIDLLCRDSGYKLCYLSYKPCGSLLLCLTRNKIDGGHWNCTWRIVGMNKFYKGIRGCHVAMKALLDNINGVRVVRHS